MQPSPLPTGAIDQWTLVLGFFMPLLVAVIIQSHWPKGFKAIVAALSCLTAAVIQLTLKGELDLSHLGTAVLSILALSITFLKGFWGPLGLTGLIENSTNFARRQSGNDSPADNTNDPQ
jgi:hypothetical protein